ncbi:MAG: hypothetical protein HRT45_13190 [Bdellovibrionales bacterium]|nr:hypothetical protein [Bdellovibrionales bacterium]
MAMVVLLRLDSTQGFVDMGDALRVAMMFKEKGIDAVAEPAPAIQAEGIHIFYIKVPEDQLEKARSMEIEF